MAGLCGPKGQEMAGGNRGVWSWGLRGRKIQGYCSLDAAKEAGDLCKAAPCILSGWGQCQGCTGSKRPVKVRAVKCSEMRLPRALTRQMTLPKRKQWDYLHNQTCTLIASWDYHYFNCDTTSINLVKSRWHYQLTCKKRETTTLTRSVYVLVVL